MFKKILIANRGAIATRIIRTLKHMGIQSVAVYAEADAHSLHVQYADEAFSLGDGNASDTYLDIDKLLNIIRQSGAEAVHPGYGFLSENPEFVQRCEKDGIAFIGPTTEHMLAFGLKHKARELALANKVPLLPGTALLSSSSEAVTAAGHIGYPVILKSTAGGGGIGMQVCNTADELHQAFDSIRRLSANNFSNDGVFVEKYIAYARHIEVQVFGDGKGRAVTFGERDCSAQRRHQKVIEETPAPNIPSDVRQQLHANATTLLAAVNYRNAGTVEYIYDQREDTFYFLEVNTRLQVEHGVTEAVFDIDLVEWMILLAAGELGDIVDRRKQCHASGHAIQARVYAENPFNQFQPSAGLISHLYFPTWDNTRIDHWITSGLEVSPFFDPMLAKVICKRDNRDDAITALTATLAATQIQGIETNIEYLQALLSCEKLQRGELYTRYLNNFRYTPNTIDVIAGGTLTSIQDYPGRVGYWEVGVPPSGPFDSVSFRLGNRILGNQSSAAGLEITLQGPTLKFNQEVTFVLTGAAFDAQLDNKAVAYYRPTTAKAGQILHIEKPHDCGARCYLLVAGGLDGNDYLNSRSTFTLGQFGGFSGRRLRTGDVLHLAQQPLTNPLTVSDNVLPSLSHHWQVHVIYGPHGAPDFFTQQDIDTFFNAQWEVHYNSSRTGIRLIGPKPDWARRTGGEAGMHPSNIHDNAYAIGTVDFTGDMPVILGPDGPSLGGFVCPATVVHADLWKLGQLRAGDKVKFIPITIAQAELLERAQEQQLSHDNAPPLPAILPADIRELSPIVHRYSGDNEVIYRVAGDKYLLVEYGDLTLDIRLRFRAHALMLHLQKAGFSGILELTPGIRSLQIHYDNHLLPLNELLSLLTAAEDALQGIENLAIPARIVHLPLSWNDSACQLAVEKYTQSVRKDAPWCPDNIEFIRRINGLESVDDVKRIVFDASYVVMGLGDVYLGAPVATPIDPRHRLVTTKYNPARTWTAENSVGIGGAYLCVYGMEGPGGYQFVGRTLQMWNTYFKTREFSQPWLLRFFDQIRFYEVTEEELQDIRTRFPRGDYPIKIENTEFSLSDYEHFLQDNDTPITHFSNSRQAAFDEELQRWIDSGQINFSSEISPPEETESSPLAENCTAVAAQVAGSIWQWQVEPGNTVTAGETVCILESMKMEIDIVSPCNGKLIERRCTQGQQVHAGQIIGVIENDDA